MTTNRDCFLGLRQLPSCTHEPQVVLETSHLKACLECAFSCMKALIPLVDVIYIRDGELNATAKALLIERRRPTASENQTPTDESGGRESY